MSFSGAERQQEPLKFEEVRRRWAIVEDGALAKELQNDEVTEHFDINRKTRHMVRSDIQMARSEQDREQLRVQADRLRRIEEQRRRAEDLDAPVLTAVQPLEPLPAFGGPSSSQEDDDGARMAQLELERKDELMARNLQDREERRYERWKRQQKEKELQREKRHLEREIAAEVEASHHATEENGDFSDFCRIPEDATDTTKRRVQAEQDADIARLLQEQEAKRQGGERRRLEEKDRRLAEVIQQLERLRAERKRRRRKREPALPSTDMGTQTAPERAQSPIYDNVAASTSMLTPLQIPPIDSNEEEGHGTLYFDSGSPLVDKEFVGSPVTRLDDKIRAGSRLVRRPAGARESLIEAVTGSAELGAQLAQRGSHYATPTTVNSGTNSSGDSSTVKGSEYAQGAIQSDRGRGSTPASTVSPDRGQGPRPYVQGRGQSPGPQVQGCGQGSGPQFQGRGHGSNSQVQGRGQNLGPNVQGRGYSPGPRGQSPGQGRGQGQHGPIPGQGRGEGLHGQNPSQGRGQGPHGQMPGQGRGQSPRGQVPGQGPSSHGQGGGQSSGSTRHRSRAASSSGPELPARNQPSAAIPRVIAVDPPAGHQAQVRQPGPFAFENSTLFRPAMPFSSPETATTPLGPTFNIAAAIDPTYRPEASQRRPRAQSAGPHARPLSMHELGGRTAEWEEGVPVPIHGERRRPSDPRLDSSSADKKSGNCKVQ